MQILKNLEEHIEHIALVLLVNTLRMITYFSTYGEDRAIILATRYVTQMKKLITEERTRLEQLKESMYAIC